MRRRARIPQRRRVFIGCEGTSESSYAALLQRMADASPSIHIHIEHRSLNPGAGDPRQLVKRAAQLIGEMERNRVAFAIKALFIDRTSPDICDEAVVLARKASIGHIVWQNPGHEAMLLRHLPGCKDRRPTKGASMAALVKEWREYRKAMPAAELATRINIDGLAAAASIEPDLHNLIAALGFRFPSR